MTPAQNLYYRVVKHFPINIAGIFIAALVGPLLTNLVTGDWFPHQNIILISGIVAVLSASYISKINKDINSKIDKIKDQESDTSKRLLASISYSKPGRASKFLVSFFLLVIAGFIFLSAFIADLFALHYRKSEKTVQIPKLNIDSLLSINNRLNSRMVALESDSTSSHILLDSVTILLKECNIKIEQPKPSKKKRTPVK